MSNPNFEYTFPHAKFNIRDDSQRDIPPLVEKGLHQPVFIVQAERGPVNVPMYGNAAFHMNLYGDKTFFPGTKFFMHQNLFAMYAARHQQFWMIRVADDTVAASSLVLKLTLTPADIPQYQKDVYGAWILDVNGDPIPELDGGSQPIMEPGFTSTFVVEAIPDDTAIDALTPTTETIGSDTVTTYPLIALRAKDVGGFGDFYGFKLYRSTATESSVVDALGTMVYRFEPVYINDATNNTLPVRNRYSMSYVDVSLKEDAQDPLTALVYDLKYRLESEYYLGQGDLTTYTFPFDMHVYHEHIGTVADEILGVSTELTDAGVTTWLVDVLEGNDLNGNPYDHYRPTNATQFFNQNRVMFCQGGSDGQVDTPTLEGLVADYLTGDVYPKFLDKGRYPFTHFYDSGFSLAMKLEIVNLLALRPDMKIDFTTQDASLPPNETAEDLSTGASIRTALLLHPESTVFGTQVCRASIYTQSATLNEYPRLKFTAPASIDRMIKRCKYNVRPYITGLPVTRPNSEVTIFDTRTLNWTPILDDVKQQTWGFGYNYMEYADTNVVFYADLRSVYPIDSSLLSDDLLIDALVYTMHIVRRKWTVYAGDRGGNVNDPAHVRTDIITTDIDQALQYAFNGHYMSNTLMYQTERDQALGYRWTVEVQVRSRFPNRVWNVIVPVDRLEG